MIGFQGQDLSDFIHYHSLGINIISLLWLVVNCNPCLFLRAQLCLSCRWLVLQKRCSARATTKRSCLQRLRRRGGRYGPVTRLVGIGPGWTGRLLGENFLQELEHGSHGSMTCLVSQVCAWLQKSWPTHHWRSILKNQHQCEHSWWSPNGLNHRFCLHMITTYEQILYGWFLIITPGSSTSWSHWLLATLAHFGDCHLGLFLGGIVCINEYINIHK